MLQDAGGLYARRWANVSDCVFRNSTAARNGGALAGDTLVVRGCAFSELQAGSPISWMMTGISQSTIGAGGGIYGNLDVTILNSTFANSHADQFGGALCGVRGVTVEDSSFTNCSAGFYGGVIAVMEVALTPGPLVVRRSAVRGASTSLDGGAFYSENPVLVEDTTFEGTTAGRNGGALCSRSDRNGQQAADLVVVRSSFAGSASGEAGGAVFGSGARTVVSGCLFRNSTAALVRHHCFSSGAGPSGICRAVIPAAPPCSLSLVRKRAA